MQLNHLSAGSYSPLHSEPAPAPAAQLNAAQLNAAGNSAAAAPSDLREAFDSFVGETFYSHLLSAMRKTVDKPAYFHGGRAEEVFQGQLDQILAQQMTQASAAQFTGPMFELFTLGRP